MRAAAQITSIATFFIVAGLVIWLISGHLALKKAGERASVEAGLAVVSTAMIDQFYEGYPADEMVRLDGLWTGDEGKLCGVANEGPGHAFQFVRLTEGPDTYSTSRMADWDRAIWERECRTVVIEHVPLR